MLSTKMEEVMGRLRREIQGADVVIYSSATCQTCSRAKQFLTELGLDFNEIELDQDPDKGSIQDGLLIMSHQRTVPNIFIKGKHIGGLYELAEKYKAGKLQTLLDSWGFSFLTLTPEQLAELTSSQ